ncbi:MAG: hypothetical protein ABL901_07110 [Hyphomicrobiaceae bacterium]
MPAPLPSRPAVENMRVEPHVRAGAGAHGWRRHVMGWAFGWAWFDRLTLFMLERIFFPTSRMWAAARVSKGSPDAFFDFVPMPRRFEDKPHLTVALARFEEALARSTALEAAWEKAFFGSHDTTVTQRAALEAARLDAGQSLNITRRLFARYLLRAIPHVRLDTQTPDQASALYPDINAGIAPLAALPPVMPPVEVSRAVPGTVGRDYWLRFKSPSARLGDIVTARVHEPIGVVNPPTIILGHGVCIEFDHWRGLVDETDELVALGFRVIRPEAPWHGRRAKAGCFAGEPIIATFPTGSLDAFTGALQEWAVLADWSRRTSTGPLTMGGTSLGAQMAQLAADRSRDWPEALRPEALLLITHCGEVAEAVLHGALPEIFGSADDVAAKGWTPELIQAFLAPLNPGRTAPIDRNRIVSVLGRFDRVTPFASGQALVRDWDLPPENVFILERGHFSVPMTLIRRPAALQRFQTIVSQLPSPTA